MGFGAETRVEESPQDLPESLYIHVDHPAALVRLRDEFRYGYLFIIKLLHVVEDGHDVRTLRYPVGSDFTLPLFPMFSPSYPYEVDIAI